MFMRLKYCKLCLHMSITYMNTSVTIAIFYRRHTRLTQRKIFIPYVYDYLMYIYLTTETSVEIFLLKLSSAVIYEVIEKQQ